MEIRLAALGVVLFCLICTLCVLIFVVPGTSRGFTVGFHGVLQHLALCCMGLPRNSVIIQRGWSMCTTVFVLKSGQALVHVILSPLDTSYPFALCPYQLAAASSAYSCRSNDCRCSIQCQCQCPTTPPERLRDVSAPRSHVESVTDVNRRYSHSLLTRLAPD